MNQSFNPLIIDKLEEYDLLAERQDEALLYLLSIHYSLESQCFNEEIIRTVNLTKIVERDYHTTPVKLVWNIPLFGTAAMNEEEAWQWVNLEYRPIFSTINVVKAGDKRGCIGKMKKFFAANPEVRKDDVIAAARLYVAPFGAGAENPKYMVQADYFISKQVENVKKSRLEQYLEIVLKQRKESNGSNSRFTVIT
jgi:hypothetical protein